MGEDVPLDVRADVVEPIIPCSTLENAWKNGIVLCFFDAESFTNGDEKLDLVLENVVRFACIIFFFIP